MIAPASSRTSAHCFAAADEDGDALLEGTMSSTSTILRTLPITRKIAFRLLRAGKYKKASDMAHDALLQVPKRIKTPDTEALHVIAATAYYAAEARA